MRIISALALATATLVAAPAFAQDTTDTAADKMAKVLEAESRCQISPGP